AEARVAGFAAQRLTRCERFRPRAIAELLQALRVREIRERNLAQRIRAAVGEAGLHDTARIDVDADEAAGRIAVLRRRVAGVYAGNVMLPPAGAVRLPALSYVSGFAPPTAVPST